MRIQRLRFVFRVKLTTEKPGMFASWQLNYLNKLPVGRHSAKFQTRSFQSFTKLRIKLITMPMSLADLFRCVSLFGQRTRRKIARPGAQPHCSAKLIDIYQIAKLEDHRIRTLPIKFSGVSILKPANISRKLNASCLHSEADAKVGRATLTGISYGANHSGYATFTKSARDQDRIKVAETGFIIVIHEFF